MYYDPQVRHKELEREIINQKRFQQKKLILHRCMQSQMPQILVFPEAQVSYILSKLGKSNQLAVSHKDPCQQASYAEFSPKWRVHCALQIQKSQTQFYKVQRQVKI